MQVHDARVLRTAAIPALAVGIVAAIVCGVLSGGKGVLGAGLGVVLVAGFFSVSVVVVSRVARGNPTMLMNMALLTYVVKIIVLGILMFAFRDVSFIEPKQFAWTVIACTIAWISGEAYAFSRLRILYVEPAPLPAPSRAAASSSSSSATQREAEPREPAASASAAAPAGKSAASGADQ